MNKIAILGDTHFGCRADSIEFHKYFQKFYDDVFFPFLKENGIKQIVQLGDLFDRRKYINFNSLYLSRKYFFDKLKEEGIEMFTLLGNHDVAYKNTLEVNSSSMLLESYDNIHVLDEFETMSFSGIDIDIVPWLCDDNENIIFEKIKESRSQICFGHFEIDGFEMDRGNIHHGGLDRKTLSKYDVVLSGHFHHRSNGDNITYVGTPYEMTWSDYNDPKGFHLFDLNTRELEFIRNPFRMFHKVVYDDEKTDFDHWKKFDYNLLKETFVKVVVINKQNPYLFDTVIDNLYKAGASDISVVEDFTDITDINVTDEEIDQAEDTITIINKFVDSMKTDVEAHKLKNILKEIYIEALNVEKTE
jgi:DNA repair exonuclease SbcCD nuclease subunit